MEILYLKTTIVLYVRDKDFRIIVEHNNKDKPESLKWRNDTKDSYNSRSSSIDNGENGIIVNDHDNIFKEVKRELFLLSYIIGFPKTYRKIIIKKYFLHKNFWTDHTYMTAFNSLNVIIKNKYDYQKSN